MGKFDAVQIKFDKDYLNKLTEDEDSGVSKQNCTYHIALHPAQFADFGQSIKDELGRKIAKYDDMFQGIMLGYEKLKVKSDLGVIGVDNCYVHVDILGDFFVFRPEIGMILKGIVTRTTTDHVGCLVYSTFNISLPKPEDDESWLGTRAAIQNDILFKIIFVDLTARLPYIRGELLEILNDITDINPLGSKKNKKLNKKIKFEAASDQENSLSTEPKKKRKKKHTGDEESMENIEINGEDFVGESKKRNKKRKISSLEISQEEDSFISKSKKKHKKSHKKDNESFKEHEEMEENEDYYEESSKNNIDKVVNDTSKKSKKKHKKSAQIHNESFEESPENLKIEKDDFWNGVSRNITTSITSEYTDNMLNNSAEKPKKKHKKSAQKHNESLEETPEKKHKKSSQKYNESFEEPQENLKVEEEFWDKVSKNITSSINSEDNDKMVNNSTEKTKKKNKKSAQKNSESFEESSEKKHKKSAQKYSESFEESPEHLKIEKDDFWNGVSRNITTSITSEYTDNMLNNSAEKPKKKHKKSAQKHNESLEETPEKKHKKSSQKYNESFEEPQENLKVEEEFWDKVSKNITSSINSEDNDKMVNNSTEKTKKKNKKSAQKNSESFEESSEKKHKKSAQKYSESFEESPENLKIEKEEFWNGVSKNITSSINLEDNDKVLNNSPENPKKKHKKSAQKISESFEERPEKKHKKSAQEHNESFEESPENLKIEDEYWDKVSKNITSSINLEDNDKVLHNSPEKPKKKHKKSAQKTSESFEETPEKKHKKSAQKHNESFEESPENLKVEEEEEEFWNNLTRNNKSSINSGDNDKVVNNSTENTKKKNKKSAQKNSESFGESSEKKHKKSAQKHRESFEESPENLKVEEEEFWNNLTRNITTSINSGNDDKVVNNSPKNKSKKEPNKSHKKKTELLENPSEKLKVENVGFWEEISQNIKVSIRGEKPETKDKTIPKNDKEVKESLDTNLQHLLEDEMNRVNRKHKKKRKQKPDPDDKEMLEKREKRKKKKEKRHQEEEDLSMGINSLFNLNSSQNKDNSTPQSKKKNKQNLINEAIENIVIKKEKTWEETMLGDGEKHKPKTTEKPDYRSEVSLSKKKKPKEKNNTEQEGDTSFNIQSLFNSSSVGLNNTSLSQSKKDTTPKSKRSPEKHYNDELLQNIEIKTEIKKEDEELDKVILPDFNEDILKKQAKRREKKKTQEQDDSLESLDIKPLFSGKSMNLNSSFQTMANAEDRGKKRRSSSVSRQVYLETIKLEVDSEMERITSGNKRKKSKSFST